MGIQYMSYGMAKNLPYKKSIDAAILRLKETGLLTRILNEFYPHPPDCSDIDENPYKPVSMLFVFSAYYTLCVGYKAAILIFIIEIIVFKCQSRQGKSQEKVKTGKEEIKEYIDEYYVYY